VRDDLIEILEKSVERNGEKPLTNKWLLNCLKMAKRKQEQHEHLLDMEECRAELDL
jgi:hypothetical protein